MTGIHHEMNDWTHKLKIQQFNIHKNYHQNNSKRLYYEILQSEIQIVAGIISERKSDYYNKLAQ